MKHFVKGIPNLSARMWFAMLRQQQKKQDAVFVIKAEEADEALNSAESLFAILPKDIQKPRLCLWEGDTAQQSDALKDLCRKSEDSLRFHIVSEQTMADYFPDSTAYEEMTIRVSRGGTYPRGNLTRKLTEHGYERVYFVEDRGEYAVRGSVLDVFPLSSEKPIRLFFEDDDLSAIRYFEIDTQHTSGFLEKLEIPPRDFGDIKRPFLSFLGENYFVVSEDDFLEDNNDENQDSDDAQTDSSEDSEDEEIQIEHKKIPLADKIPCMYITGGLQPEYSEDFGAARNVPFSMSPDILASEMLRLRKEGCDVHFFCINNAEAQRIARQLQGKKLGGQISPDIGYIAEGFVCPKEKIAIITSAEYLGRKYSFSRETSRSHKKFFKWSDLKPGDYVVHEDYGIARYRGLKKVYYKSSDGKTLEDSDCLYLEYARGDTLFVPLDDFTKVQKFISSEGKQPHLSHMDTKTWGEMKHRVREEVRDMAENILRLEAERAMFHTAAFESGGEIEEAFAEGFPYQLTPDQEKAIDDVLHDMEGHIPMNRLLAGDVGFGKTEVAMRAAMRAVANGFQAAIVAPTTILANQHYNNFVERFAGFPVRIRELSRFVPKRDQKRYLKELEEGTVDIVVGTHRLLQKDVRFFNLGLMAVDEEHRFGVKAKDMIKEKAKGVHCLLMSATPIPRTLYQSLSALKSMSVIETPPPGRQAADTFVRPFSEKDAASAVAYELSRGGQVYYVHNRVQTIESRKSYLKRIMPELRIAVVHGQLDSDSVSETMKEFQDRKYDVLLATTIIESGIDIPNVNTLIVENAHEMGLAQLYQLRGRVGRSKRKGYCYLYYPGWIRPEKFAAIKSGHYSVEEQKRRQGADGKETVKTVSEDAARRLKAIEEFTALGSGLRLAMRDLEIRGAGDLLGMRQHGFINSVGLEMYIQLLNGEINRLKGLEIKEELPDPRLDIVIAAFVPESYITDEMERINYYKKILKSDLPGLRSIQAELEDIAGPAPEPVIKLFRAAALKKRLAKIGVRSAGQIKDNLEIFFRRDSAINENLVRYWAKVYGTRLHFIQSKDGDGLRFSDISAPLSMLDNFVKITENFLKN